MDCWTIYILSKVTLNNCAIFKWCTYILIKMWFLFCFWSTDKPHIKRRWNPELFFIISFYYCFCRDAFVIFIVTLISNYIYNNIHNDIDNLYNVVTDTKTFRDLDISSPSDRITSGCIFLGGWDCVWGGGDCVGSGSGGGGDVEGSGWTATSLYWDCFSVCLRSSGWLYGWYRLFVLSNCPV